MHCSEFETRRLPMSGSIAPEAESGQAAASPLLLQAQVFQPTVTALGLQPNSLPMRRGTFLEFTMGSLRPVHEPET